jgi:hypothetical protein
MANPIALNMHMGVAEALTTNLSASNDESLVKTIQVLKIMGDECGYVW